MSTKTQPKWSIYLLASGTRTYIGATTDVPRRIRQHDGEIRGGARSTRGKKWILVCYLEGFQNRSEAYRWEKIIKSRCRGIRKRREAFWDLWLGIQPPGKQYPLPKQSLAYGGGYWKDESNE